MTRLAVTTSLDAWDIPALRFGVAGLVLLAVAGEWPSRMGWVAIALISAGVYLTS